MALNGTLLKFNLNGWRKMTMPLRSELTESIVSVNVWLFMAYYMIYVNANGRLGWEDY